MPAPAPVAPGTIRDDLIVEDEPRLAELVRAARRWLPKYALPEHVVPLLRFPLKGSESRKLDKDVLPPPRAEHHVGKVGRGAPPLRVGRV